MRNSACLVIISSEKTRKRKRWWTREVFAEGPTFGNTLLNKLRLEDAMGFRNFIISTLCIGVVQICIPAAL